MDPLSDKYPNLSPYTYTANNPLNIIDPDGNYLFGLFGSTKEQRQAAREFQSSNGGTIINEHRKDIFVTYTRQTEFFGSTPAFTNKVQSFNKDGSLFSEGIGSPGNGLFDKWASSESFLGELSYKIADDVFVGLQASPIGALFTSPSNRSHLDGTETSQSEVESAFVNTLSYLVPAAKGVNVANRLNAAQFSKVFKGNLARLAPQVRGMINRAYNKGVGLINGINYNRFVARQLKGRGEDLQEH